jgi:hypothetical protein
MSPAEYTLPATTGFVKMTDTFHKIQRPPHKACYNANIDSYPALLMLPPPPHINHHAFACSKIQLHLLVYYYYRLYTSSSPKYPPNYLLPSLGRFVVAVGLTAPGYQTYSYHKTVASRVGVRIQKNLHIGLVTSILLNAQLSLFITSTRRKERRSTGNLHVLRLSFLFP